MPPSNILPVVGQPGSSLISYHSHPSPKTSTQLGVLPVHGEVGLGVGAVGASDVVGENVGNKFRAGA
jgi:hypothetical protein